MQVTVWKEPGKVPGPGIYVMPAHLYHADPAPEPSLSSSIADLLITKTPRHAAAAHPRLNPAWRHEIGNRPQQIGTAVHKLMTGRGKRLHRINFDSYQSKDAKKGRAEATELGRVPILAPDRWCATKIVKAVRAHLRAASETRHAFRAGEGELVLIWHEPGLDIWCRTMVDWIGPEIWQVWDLKTVTTGCDDANVSRRLADGLDLQAAFIRRGYGQFFPEQLGRMQFGYVFAEQSEPFAVRVVEPGPSAWHYGERKLLTAMEMWSHSMAAETWRGYPLGLNHVAYPAWQAKQWDERELDDVYARVALQRLGNSRPAPIKPEPREVNVFG